MFSVVTMVSRPAARRKRVMGLLAVMSLNLFMLPCAMAFQIDADCPHCPPAANHEMTAHHGHVRETVQPPCTTVQPNCCDTLTATVDNRASKPIYKPTPDLVPMGVSVPPAAANYETTPHLGAADPPAIKAASPPLHVLFCVYLD